MRTLFTAFALVSSSVVLGRLVQKPGLVIPDTYSSNRATVEKIFDTSYEAYRSAQMFHISQVVESVSKEIRVWT